MGELARHGPRHRDSLLSEPTPLRGFERLRPSGYDDGASGLLLRSGRNARSRAWDLEAVAGLLRAREEGASRSDSATESSGPHVAARDASTHDAATEHHALEEPRRTLCLTPGRSRNEAGVCAARSPRSLSRWRSWRLPPPAPLRRPARSPWSIRGRCLGARPKAACCQPGSSSGGLAATRTSFGSCSTALVRGGRRSPASFRRRTGQRRPSRGWAPTGSRSDIRRSRTPMSWASWRFETAEVWPSCSRRSSRGPTPTLGPDGRPSTREASRSKPSPPMRSAPRRERPNRSRQRSAEQSCAFNPGARWRRSRSTTPRR